MLELLGGSVSRKLNKKTTIFITNKRRGPVLARARAMGIPAINLCWVEDCLAEKTKLNLQSYIIEPETMHRQSTLGLDTTWMDPRSQKLITDYGAYMLSIGDTTGFISYPKVNKKDKGEKDKEAEIGPSITATGTPTTASPPRLPPKWSHREHILTLLPCDVQIEPQSPKSRKSMPIHSSGRGGDKKPKKRESYRRPEKKGRGEKSQSQKAQDFQEMMRQYESMVNNDDPESSGIRIPGQGSKIEAGKIHTTIFQDRSEQNPDNEGISKKKDYKQGSMRSLTGLGREIADRLRLQDNGLGEQNFHQQFQQSREESQSHSHTRVTNPDIPARSLSRKSRGQSHPRITPRAHTGEHGRSNTPHVHTHTHTPVSLGSKPILTSFNQNIRSRLQTIQYEIQDPYRCPTGSILLTTGLDKLELIYATIKGLCPISSECLPRMLSGAVSLQELMLKHQIKKPNIQVGIYDIQIDCLHGKRIYASGVKNPKLMRQVVQGLSGSCSLTEASFLKLKFDIIVSDRVIPLLSLQDKMRTVSSQAFVDSLIKGSEAS